MLQGLRFLSQSFLLRMLSDHSLLRLEHLVSLLTPLETLNPLAVHFYFHVLPSLLLGLPLASLPDLLHMLSFRLLSSSLHFGFLGFDGFGCYLRSLPLSIRSQ